MSLSQSYLSPRSRTMRRGHERPGQTLVAPATTTLGTRSGANYLWEPVTPTAGKPRQMPRSPHIPDDIYRWGPQLAALVSHGLGGLSVTLICMFQLAKYLI